jgi:acyl-CoA reductase-like NAD-dependent aldehyde dehydrogenase
MLPIVSPVTTDREACSSLGWPMSDGRSTELLRFTQLIAEAEIFPPGVFNVVTGDGLPAGDAIVKNKDVGIVSLTGESSTGKLIAKNAADTLKRVHLELGGKAPVVVFDDADVSAAAEWIQVAGFFNSGRTARPRPA